MSGTTYHSVVCDECASQYVDKMELMKDYEENTILKEI